MDPVLINGQRTDKNRTEAEYRAEHLPPGVPADHEADAYLDDTRYLSDAEAFEALQLARRHRRQDNILTVIVALVLFCILAACALAGYFWEGK